MHGQMNIKFLKCFLQESVFLIPIVILLLLFFFLQSNDIPTIIWISPKYYSMPHNLLGYEVREWIVSKERSVVIFKGLEIRERTSETDYLML